MRSTRQQDQEEFFLGIVNEFCEQAWQMYRSGLPRATRQKSEQRLLDSLGNALAATASEIDQGHIRSRIPSCTLV